MSWPCPSSAPACSLHKTIVSFLLTSYLFPYFLGLLLLISLICYFLDLLPVLKSSTNTRLFLFREVKKKHIVSWSLFYYWMKLTLHYTLTFSFNPQPQFCIVKTLTSPQHPILTYMSAASMHIKTWLGAPFAVLCNMFVINVIMWLCNMLVINVIIWTGDKCEQVINVNRW